MEKRDRVYAKPFDKKMRCRRYYNVKTYDDIKNINICDDCYDDAINRLELQDIRKRLDELILKTDEVGLKIDEIGLEINGVILKMNKTKFKNDEGG